MNIRCVLGFHDWQYPPAIDSRSFFDLVGAAETAADISLALAGFRMAIMNNMTERCTRCGETR